MAKAGKSKLEKTLVKLLDGNLESDENVEMGIRVNLKGTALGVGLSALAGVGGVVAVAGTVLGANKSKESDDQAASSGIEFARQMALVLTNKRMIFFNRSSLSGKPKEIIGILPYDQIKGVEYSKGSLMNKLILNFDEDRNLELEAVKIDNTSGFVDALSAYIA